MDSLVFVRHTFVVVVPAGLVACLVLFILGYADIAQGVLLGVGGGMVKSFLMANSVMRDRSAVKSFLIRYLAIAIVFVLGITISVNAFFATVAGLFFVHIIFILDQVKASKARGIE
ncbi:MAG: hypothetical protein JW920_01600 [Deltaproteobacteria bacterium]|nr:hypothetical protein [Deltaproteobacteria bacterium]